MGRRLVSGYLRALLDTEVAAGLRQAFSAKTYSELLAGLATPGNPFIINPEALRREAGRLFLSTQRLSEHEALVNRGAVGARLSSKIITTAEIVLSKILRFPPTTTIRTCQPIGSCRNLGVVFSTCRETWPYGLRQHVGSHKTPCSSLPSTSDGLIATNGFQ